MEFIIEILGTHYHTHIAMLVITYHRDDVNFVTESLHKLYVELFEFVTVRCDEVETSVHPERQSYDIYSYVTRFNCYYKTNITSAMNVFNIIKM